MHILECVRLIWSSTCDIACGSDCYIYAIVEFEVIRRDFLVYFFFLLGQEDAHRKPYKGRRER